LGLFEEIISDSFFLLNDAISLLDDIKFSLREPYAFFIQSLSSFFYTGGPAKLISE